ncbi:hypothetical protein EB118_18635 [bacterium]|nr:hypothetical protein [bacterium]NDG32079.1 hypothetical protein [bacterium]
MAKGKSFGDVVKSVISEEKNIDEKVEVGGGTTGTSYCVDPHGGQTPTRTADKRNGEAMSKGQNPANTPIEDTPTDSNVKPTGDSSTSNKSSIAAKPSAASPSMKEHIDAIFKGEDLSEDFRAKATTIFEAAVSVQLKEEVNRLEEEYQELLEQSFKNLTEELVEKVDQYMTYAVEQWMQDNQVAIESSIKTEISEGFITGLKSLFEEHYIEIPEDKVDVLGEMASKVDELEEKLNASIKENIQLKSQLSENTRDKILADVSEGLAATQVEKLAALAEGVDFDTPENFKKKLEIVKDNYFPSVISTKQLFEEVEEEALAFNEEQTKKVVAVDPSVSAYVSALSRTVKK